MDNLLRRGGFTWDQATMKRVLIGMLLHWPATVVQFKMQIHNKTFWQAFREIKFNHFINSSLFRGLDTYILHWVAFHFIRRAVSTGLTPILFYIYTRIFRSSSTDLPPQREQRINRENISTIINTFSGQTAQPASLQFIIDLLARTATAGRFFAPTLLVNIISSLIATIVSYPLLWVTTVAISGGPNLKEFIEIYLNLRRVKIELSKARAASGRSKVITQTQLSLVDKMRAILSSQVMKGLSNRLWEVTLSVVLNSAFYYLCILLVKRGIELSRKAIATENEIRRRVAPFQETAEREVDWRKELTFLALIVVTLTWLKTLKSIVTYPYKTISMRERAGVTSRDKLYRGYMFNFFVSVLFCCFRI
eukprot:TRINITY_DN12276_c0_g1_i1.p1 TRINITY_DN12276_c0_g1~~TRINITY_DN12276_c0_g1_i1.p1  ORF type:complete len:364 (-),score=62.92 TRINITY_DN12276_c0_g1_i1:14-1105(-)